MPLSARSAAPIRNRCRHRPRDRLGLGPACDQRASVGEDRAGAQARCQACRHRPAPNPLGPGRRLAPADPHRLRRRTGPRPDAHPGARRPRRPHLSGREQRRLRTGGTPRAAALPTGSRRRDHRAVAQRRGASGRPLRRRSHAIHTHRFRHEPLLPWRAEPAHRGAAARRHRRLWPLWRRRDAGNGGLLRSQLQRRAQTIRTGHVTHHQPPEARRGPAACSRSADPRSVHRRQQPGGDQSGHREDPRRSGARGPVHRRARPVHDRDRALRRYRAAGDDLSGNRGFLPQLRHLLHAVWTASGGAARRGLVEPPPDAGHWRHGWV